MKKITSLNDINNKTEEGRYLIAAMVKLTENIPTRQNVPEAIDKILESLSGIVERTYGDDRFEVKVVDPTFQDELRSLINRHSIESGSNTPDYILAGYLITCLNNYAAAVTARDKFFNFQPWQNVQGEKIA